MSKNVSKYALPFIVPVLLTACSNSSSQPTTNTVEEPDNKSYSIMKVSDGSLDVYTLQKDSASIKKINNYLVFIYDKDRSKAIKINYFDDSTVAKHYQEISNDPNPSEGAMNGIFKHLFAHYTLNPEVKTEHFEYVEDGELAK